MVTIRTCATLPEAHIIQSQLGGSGIKTFLPDECTVQNNWMWTNAMGGIRVQVLEEDAERAEEVLGEQSIKNNADVAKSCPYCGATLKESYGFGLCLKILLVLLFSIPIRSKPTWRCSKCGVIPRHTQDDEN
jgi:hypothetical protein